MNIVVRNTFAVTAMAGMAALSVAAAQTVEAPSTPKVAQGYALSVFAKGTAKYSKPDSIAVGRTAVYVGYGDGNAPDGSDGKNTQIVKYDLQGDVERVLSVKGHNDGLKINPVTHDLWALQNEDFNPRLVIFDADSNERTLYTFQAPSNSGGGYDDIVFRQGKVYLSASNPSNTPNSGPAIVEAKLEGQTIAVTPVLDVNSLATDVVTGKTVTLNLTDPDSMTLDPSGDLFLTSQADSQLIVVRNPGKGKSQSVLEIPVTSPYGPAMVDDTLFTPNADGYILIADKNANTVYKLRKNAFVPGSAYSAAQASDGTTGGTTYSFVGKLDPEYGLLTPVVTNLGNPGGLAFVKTNAGDSELEDLLDFCSAISLGK